MFIDNTMDLLAILLISFTLFIMFAGLLALKILYKRKKEIILLSHYEEIIQPDNVYELKDYRDRHHEVMMSDELSHRLRYKLVWSEELQKYIKTPRSTKD